MQNLKQWEKTGEGKYAFSVDSKHIGSMQLLGGDAAITIGDKEFKIKRIGFWKAKTEVWGINGEVIIKIYPKKWYATSLIVEFDNKNYNMLYRNNPLVECVITENGSDVLSYSLNAENGKAGVKITSANRPVNYLFDFLLWFWFAPIAAENIGDTDVVFICMV